MFVLLDKLFPAHLAKKNPQNPARFRFHSRFHSPSSTISTTTGRQQPSVATPPSSEYPGIPRQGAPPFPIIHLQVSDPHHPPQFATFHTVDCFWAISSARRATCPPQTLPGDCGGNQITGYRGGERNMIFPECRRLSVWSKVEGGRLVCVGRGRGVALSVEARGRSRKVI